MKEHITMMYYKVNTMMYYKVNGCKKKKLVL